MEQFIMANDTALRISDSGRGETTLALLHGYLESLEVWEDLAKRLAPYYRICEARSSFLSARISSISRSRSAFFCSVSAFGVEWNRISP